jgi:hypothetical protein
VARRKPWSELSPGYRARLEKAGITKSQHARGATLKKARGHAKTPEHGIRDAIRNPAKFREYIAKNPEQEARILDSLRDQAYRNVKARLGDYHKYRDKNVRVNVYGGVRGPQITGELEFNEMDGMTLDEARWTAKADTEALRSRASRQQAFNPWFYH